MIIFKNVRFRNLMSYGNAWTEIRLNQFPTTAFIGESGSGKSSVEDVISFVLYNRPFRPINKGEIVNTINNGDAIGEIEFSNNGHEYKVRRGIKPSIFEIFADGLLINQDSHTKDYQEYLEKVILGINFRSFIHVVLLGMVNFTPFMKMKAQERREFIGDLLDIGIFAKMSTLLKDRSSLNKTAISENGLLVVNTKEKIIMFNKFLSDVKKDKDRQIQDNVVAIHKNDLDQKALEEEVTRIRQSADELELLVPDRDLVSKKIKNFSDIKKELISKIREVTKDLKFYEEHTKCPTCFREFDPEHHRSNSTSKGDKKREYETGLEKVSFRIAELKIREDEIDAVAAQISTLTSNMNRAQTSIAVLQEYNKKIAKENIKLAAQRDDSTEYHEKISALETSLLDLEHRREMLASDKLIQEIAARLLKDGGIKAKIIKQYVPIINKLVNRFLDAMDFNISFTIDENFSETIKERGRDSRSYASLSDGERQRLDIAILLTWRTIATLKNSIKTNLLFIDELLDSSLGQETSEAIIELINNEPILKDSNIFVITHKTVMADKFSATIKFEKIKNFSRIIQ